MDEKKQKNKNRKRGDGENESAEIVSARCTHIAHIWKHL